jgi:uncharacterized Fe-S radical SAM superfamily protein PflX
VKKRERFGIYSEDCLRCKSLVPSATEKFEACHFSKGNKFCPASEVQVVVVGKALDYAKRVLAARQKRHIKTEAKILNLVANEPEAFRERFYAFLENPEGL